MREKLKVEKKKEKERKKIENGAFRLISLDEKKKVAHLPSQEKQSKWT